MAITMMISKEKAEAINFLNVSIVTNYPGAETKYIAHAWECPNRNNQHDTARSETCLEGCKHRDPLYMYTTHQGLVIETGENNRYDDSDFYALAWNPETQKIDRVEYATTRGWSYPNNASVDASEETLKAVADYQKKLADAAQKRHNEAEAKIPKPGRKVKVYRGRKVPIGTTGEVFYMGRDAYKKDYSNPAARYLMTSAEYFQVDLYRVGILLEDGSKVFTAASNVQVIF